MAKRKKAVAPLHPLAVLSEVVLDQRSLLTKLQQPGPTHVQADNWEESVDPGPFETMLHGPGGHHIAEVWDNLVYYHPGYVDPDTEEEVIEGWKVVAPPAPFAIKVRDDKKANKVDAQAFGFTIPRDCNGTKLRWAKAFNTTPGSGNTTVNITNVTRGVNLLTTPLIIPSGGYDSDDGPAYVINTGGLSWNPNHKVYNKNRMWINVIAIGGGSKGLGVYLAFA